MFLIIRLYPQIYFQKQLQKLKTLSHSIILLEMISHFHQLALIFCMIHQISYCDVKWVWNLVSICIFHISNLTRNSSFFFFFKIFTTSWFSLVSLCFICLVKICYCLVSLIDIWLVRSSRALQLPEMIWGGTFSFMSLIFTLLSFDWIKINSPCS